MKRRIPINTENSIYFLDPDDVLYCKCCETSITLCLKNNETVVISKEKETVQKFLEENNFIRVHPSYLVNRNHILLVDIANDYTLILSNREKIPTDEKRQNAIMEIIQNGI